MAQIHAGSERHLQNQHRRFESCRPCQFADFYFLEGMPTDNTAPPGTARPDRWRPYKLWSGDRWECEGCGATIVAGTGLRPIAEHYQDGFAAEVERLGAGQFQVNDC
jgi:hypothetical protein